MAKDLTDVLRDQLQQAVREFAENLANGSEKQRPSRRFSGMKGAVVGAGLALAAKKGIDAVRQNPALLDGVSNRISAKLVELQGREEEPDDEVEEEPELEAEGVSDEEPPADAEEDPAAEGETEPESEAEESEHEAKPRAAPKRKPRSTPSRRTAKPKARTRAKKPASTSTRRSSNSR